MLSYVLLISTIDDVLISTIGYKSELGFTSLSNYLREVNPIVICELWHRNLNKDIFVWDYSSVYLVNDLMI